MRAAAETRESMDHSILLAAIILLGAGVVMVYSASSISSMVKNQDGLYFVKKEMLAIVAGGLVMALMSNINYAKLRSLAYPLLAVTIVALIATLIPGIGIKKGGAARWIGHGALNFQPAELAKLAIVIYLAHSLSKKQEKIKTFSVGFLPHIIVPGVFIGLCLLQPDFGTAMLIGVISYFMLFVAGARLTYLLGGVVLASPAVYWLLASKEYRWKRVMVFLNPWKYQKDSGFQLVQSFIAFGAGGPFGAGLGNGKQKLFYLPEAHTDFILSVVAEEMGFIGVAAILLVFAFLIMKGMGVAMRQRDSFGMYLAAGITVMVGLGALINASVVMGLLPTKGLTLPFMSYGGSSIVVNLMALGILLNVSRNR
jgi:cell division protein FtsW